MAKGERDKCPLTETDILNFRAKYKKFGETVLCRWRKLQAAFSDKAPGRIKEHCSAIKEQFRFAFIIWDKSKGQRNGREVPLPAIIKKCQDCPYREEGKKFKVG